MKYQTEEQKDILRKTQVAYKLKALSDNPLICQGCGNKKGLPCSPGHTISRKRAHELGMPWLIYTVHNIQWMCYNGPESCHDYQELAFSEETYKRKSSLLNFNQMLGVLFLHDQERFRKAMVIMEAVDAKRFQKICKRLDWTWD